MADDVKPPVSQALTRAELEAVIRRAVELSLEDTDKDKTSEEELIRIAGELGIEPRHVRQALLERPPIEPEPPGFLAQHFSPASIVVTRAVPCPQSVAHRRMEDYLVTREYLQIRRRQGEHSFFEPADDAFSSIARSFSRPSSRYQLSRAEKAYLSIRPIDDKSCQVRLELAFPEKRRTEVQSAVVLSTITGLLGAAAGGAALGVPLLAAFGDVGATAGAMVGALLGGAGTVSATIRYCKTEYQKWLQRTRDEADALLDRLEHNETLQPPASPWLRRLQQKLRGSL